MVPCRVRSKELNLVAVAVNDEDVRRTPRQLLSGIDSFSVEDVDSLFEDGLDFPELNVVAVVTTSLAAVGGGLSILSNLGVLPRRDA